MPSSKNYVRNYKQEYATETPKRREARAMRNAARREETKALGHAIPKGFDVDHIKPLSKGGSNSKGNLQLQRAHNNRSYPRTAKGAMKSKFD